VVVTDGTNYVMERNLQDALAKLVSSKNGVVTGRSLPLAGTAGQRQ
jgi:hypothetical protein